VDADGVEDNGVDATAELVEAGAGDPDGTDLTVGAERDECVNGPAGRGDRVDKLTRSESKIDRRQPWHLEPLRASGHGGPDLCSGGVVHGCRR
jgi:hypothetical protein